MMNLKYIASLMVCLFFLGSLDAHINPERRRGFLPVVMYGGILELVTENILSLHHLSVPDLKKCLQFSLVLFGWVD
jgi:hypothetical protein